MSQVDIVCKLLTMSHVQAGHWRVSMGGLVSDTEDEGDEDVAGSQVMGSQGGGKGRTKRAASHKSKVQHILVLVVLNPDMRTYRRLLHRRHPAREHEAEVRYEIIILGSYGASLCDEMRGRGLRLKALKGRRYRAELR